MRLKYLVLAVLLLAAPATAQDDTIPDGMSGFFMHTASSATLTPNDDGTYTLSLGEPGAFVPWVAELPRMDAARVDVFAFVRSWEHAGDLTATGLLEAGDTSLRLTIGAPVHDHESAITYIATLDEIMHLGGAAKADPEPPESMGSCVLFIAFDAEFLAGLDEGLEQSMEGIRPLSQVPGNAQSR
jgi:hypothetical protein